MTHIKWPNNPTTPIPSQPSWQEEAMRQNALLHSAMMGSANAEARATQLELERDALLRVVTDNHVALQRAEAAEAKLVKVGALLPDDLYDSKDWRHADALGRIEWLIRMLANKNEEIDVWVGMLNQKEKTE